MEKRSIEDTTVAIVHDWLPVYAGAERVLEQILQVSKDADLYSLIDFVPEEQRGFLGGREVTTSFIQRLPFARSKYRYYLPLAPLAVEQFDLRNYEVVVSSSYAVAKGALTSTDQLHVCYMHSPVRYAWDLHAQYLEQDSRGKGLSGLLARVVLHYLRLFDVASANRVDTFVANSKTVARRVWNTYRREANVVYPPVDTEYFQPADTEDGDYYVALSRLVSYKRIDLVVEAFAGMPDRKLLVIGDGPQRKELEQKVGPNVRLLGHQPREAVRRYLQSARGLVFAGEEDFGIVPVEAQACGTPVLAYGKGGALETILEGETGLFFDKQQVEHVRQGVARMEEQTFDPKRVRANAEQFSAERFRRELEQVLQQNYEAFKRGELKGARPAGTSATLAGRDASTNGGVV